jgi:hypothetical protein
MSIEGELRAIRAMLEPALIKLGFSQSKPRRYSLAEARVALSMKPAELALAIRRKDIFVLTEGRKRFVPRWQIEEILEARAEVARAQSKRRRKATAKR